MISKGGYFTVDLSAVVVAAGSKVDMPGMYDACTRVAGKPVLVTYNDDGAGKTKYAWFSIMKTDDGYDIIGSIFDYENLKVKAADFLVEPDDNVSVTIGE